MPSLGETERFIASMPGATEGSRYGRRTWFVGGTQFAWVRPLTKADIRRLNGAPVPAGPIIGLVVADLAAKENLLGAGYRGIFTVSHFDGYPAVLVQLDEVDGAVLRELVTAAWSASAPPDLVETHGQDQGRHRAP
ncbi:MAG: hypothetical protein ACKODP_09570 [Actinomycetota bacterium]